MQWAIGVFLGWVFFSLQKSCIFAPKTEATVNIAVIKYNAGNIRSVANALGRIGASYEITADADAIRAADRVIFPGVGEAATTMRYLRANGLDKLICSLKQPVLGICLGMQLMCEHSEEGDADCLGIFKVPVKRFILPAENPQNIKVPHMGWNQITDLKSSLLTPDLEGEYVYYVHSYYVPVNEYTIATTNHIHPYSAAIRKGNFMATQFHPEKSGAVGEKILKNFISDKL